ncbi:uncharacterized protein [Diadema antillarum]|uniref:uncharacterized protein n=1 Tax=Diadema antillarum TaxID=105358 RepID=UPI003A84078A
MDGAEGASVDDVDVGARRMYRKKSEKSLTSPEQNTGSASVRVQLKKLSDQDIADAKMASVFGEASSSTKKPLKVNPLYDRNGTMEVPANELRRKRAGSQSGSSTTTSGTRSDHQSNGSVVTVSQNIPPTGPSATPTPEGRRVPPVSYGENFQFRNTSAQTTPRGNANNPEERKKADLGRVLPARVHKDSQPRSYSPPKIPSQSPFVNPHQAANGGAHPYQSPAPVITKTEVEEVIRRARIRRWWRCILLIILASLVFALVIIVVLVMTLR